MEEKDKSWESQSLCNSVSFTHYIQKSKWVHYNITFTTFHNNQIHKQIYQNSVVDPFNDKFWQQKRSRFQTSPIYGQTLKQRRLKKSSKLSFVIYDDTAI